MPRLIVTGADCQHNVLSWDPRHPDQERPYSALSAWTRAVEILDEFDTDGGKVCGCATVVDEEQGQTAPCDNPAAHPGLPAGPPNPCAPHRVVIEP